MSSKGFTFVTAGKRDSYQVPIALHEAGLLDCMVVDYYAPPRPSRFLPRQLASWRDERLPRSKSRIVWPAIWVTLAGALLSVKSRITNASKNGLLRRTAARTVRKLRNNLYCYHSYLPAEIPQGATLVVFVFHPLAPLERKVLLEDADNFPELDFRPAVESDKNLLRKLRVDWNRTDAVVCASNFTARSLIADGCSPEKITVIPYGLPETRVEKQPSKGTARVPDAPVKFLFVGQGVQRKGLHVLIRAWEAWRSRSSLPAELTIASYHIEPRIRALIQHPEINLLGHQPREKLDQLFSESEIFVLPSLVEGFGLVYLEALAMGCHVIGTENTGLPELPLGDKERTLVEVGSVESLVKALESCAARAIAGEFDHDEIKASAANWTQADFRARIIDHAKESLKKASTRD